MDRKKMAATSLLIAIALSTVGVAYAAWFDVVYIEGTVEMGSLTLAFDFVEPPLCNEYYLDPDTGQLVPGEWEGKDVATCEAEYDVLIEDVHTEKLGYKVLSILVENAYPQYIVHTVYVLRNIGTVPINVCKYEITGEKYDSEMNLIHDLLWDGLNPGGLWEDRNDNGVLDEGDVEVINIELVDSLPYQLDPCNTNKQEVDIDFKQEAQECHTYLFTVTVYGVQWNKPCTEIDD